MKQLAWVIMQNDYPEAVYLNRDAAYAFLKKRRDDEDQRLADRSSGYMSKIYWSIHEMSVSQ